MLPTGEDIALSDAGVVERLRSMADDMARFHVESVCASSRVARSPPRGTGNALLIPRSDEFVPEFDNVDALLAAYFHLFPEGLGQFSRVQGVCRFNEVRPSSTT